MNIITATKALQGARANDFDFAIEGELVQCGIVCDRDAADPDGGCGCGRAFAGLSSHRATTTAIIRDLELSRDDVLAAFIGYYKSGGWGDFSESDVTFEVDEMLMMASSWPLGTVLERRLDLLRPRYVHRLQRP